MNANNTMEVRQSRPWESLDIHRGSRYPQRTDLRAGDRVTIYRQDMQEAQCPYRPVKAVVVYIHPKRRYYTVQTAGGIRESFPWGCAS